MGWFREKARWYKNTRFSDIEVRSAPLLMRNYLDFDDLNISIQDKAFHGNLHDKRLWIGKVKKSRRRFLIKSWLEGGTHGRFRHIGPS